jgi:exonuclease I
MSAALAVLQMAAALEPDPVEAMSWYRSVPIAVLDGLTAAELVRQDRAHAVLSFLRAAIEIDRSERRALP